MTFYGAGLPKMEWNETQKYFMDPDSDTKTKKNLQRNNGDEIVNK